MDMIESIKESVIRADQGSVIELTKQALDSGFDAQRLLSEAFRPAMDVVGKEYEIGNIFLPEMLQSAECMLQAVRLLKPHLADAQVAAEGVVVMGTVKDDIHDIGLEIVCMTLEGAGFDVYNLGIDVPSEMFVEKVIEVSADIVGMSAFLSTTRPRYDEVIKNLEEAGLRSRVKVMIGGAAASQEYAEQIGADGYGASAGTALKMALSFMKQ
jgi:5-methyltetrahydrofolate--homocysteine methyltransferase